MLALCVVFTQPSGSVAAVTHKRVFPLPHAPQPRCPNTNAPAWSAQFPSRPQVVTVTTVSVHTLLNEGWCADVIAMRHTLPGKGEGLAASPDLLELRHICHLSVLAEELQAGQDALLSIIVVIVVKEQHETGNLLELVELQLQLAVRAEVFG